MKALSVVGWWDGWVGWVGSFVSYLFVLTVACMFVFCQGKYINSRRELINCGLQLSVAVITDFQQDHKIPWDTARPLGLRWIGVRSVKRRRWRIERRREWGHRAGLLVRLRKQPPQTTTLKLIFSPAPGPLPIKWTWWIPLATNKRLQDCSVMAITETWFHSAIPDTATAQRPGLTIHWQDCNSL